MRLALEGAFETTVQRTDTAASADNYYSLRLAPDGEGAGVNTGTGLWLLRPDGRNIRLVGRETGQRVGAVWARDGAELLSSTTRQVVRLTVGVDGPGVPLANAHGRASDWSSDGRWILMVSIGTNDSGDIVAYDVLRRSATPWLATAANETSARFSPEGQWVAYTSDASGRANVYLRRFDGSGQPIRVSTGGGDLPAWRRDGRELFFLSTGNDLMSASLARSGETITAGEPQKLFSHAISRTAVGGGQWPYDAAPDGQRFLLMVPDRLPSLLFLQGLDAVMGR